MCKSATIGTGLPAKDRKEARPPAMMSERSQTKKEQMDWMIPFASAVGIAACVGDVIATWQLGREYPGYSPLLQAMSDLGAKGSPVAQRASDWWIILGLMFLVFGIGFHRAFPSQKYASAAAWMIVLYGLGEGFGSALIPETLSDPFFALGNVAHRAVSVVGVSALVSLPFWVAKAFNGLQSPFSRLYLWLSTGGGGLFILLFIISEFYRPSGSWIAYHGLWQRLFVLIYYVFLIRLALFMLNRRKFLSMRSP